MAKQIILTQNDYGIELETQFVNDKKKPLDITDYDVRVKIIYNNETIDAILAGHKDNTNGIAYIVLEKEHLLNAGLYTTVWSVVDEDEHITAQENLYYFVKDVEGSIDDTPTTDLPIDADSILNKFKEVDDNLFELNEQKNIVNESMDITSKAISNINEQLDNISQQVKETKKYSINRFPRLTGETHDIPRINRAIEYIWSLGGGDLLFDSAEYMLKPEKPADGDTSVQGKLKRIWLRSNVNLIGIPGKSIFKVDNNNYNYHTIMEEYQATTTVLENVKLYGLTIDHNVYNNIDVPNHSINNHKETFRIHYCDNFTLEKCVIRCNGTNPLNFRMRSIQEQINMNNGKYYNKNIKIIDCDFEFIELYHQSYYDNTLITITGENVQILNNRIKAAKQDVSQIYGANTAIEVCGKNILVSNNIINNYMACMDVVSLDTYDYDKNIIIKDNIFNNCARGVDLWANKLNDILRGVSIINNKFSMNYLYHKHRSEKSNRSAICMSMNFTSALGIYKNIFIENNDFMLDDNNRDYLLSLSNDASYYDGYAFDGIYSTIFLGGKGNIIKNVKIKNNNFENWSSPCLYTGFRNVVDTVEVKMNTFLNCGYGKRSAIMTFTDKNMHFTIDSNIFLDNGDKFNGSYVMAFLNGRFFGKGGSKYWEFILINNKEYVKDGTPYNYNFAVATYYNSLVFDTIKRPIPPPIRPLRIGQEYIDTNLKKIYKSIGTTTTNDWLCLNP